jgi:thiol-disulfide isomerase/thioredoxin
VSGPYKDKFVFLDFYMEYCVWCYYIMDDFNRLITDMNTWYGPEKVAFIKVDGNKIRKLQELYKVPSYPSFVAVIPNS